MRSEGSKVYKGHFNPRSPRERATLLGRDSDPQETISIPAPRVRERLKKLFYIVPFDISIPAPRVRERPGELRSC